MSTRTVREGARCPWCRGLEDEAPELLCRPHLAEFEGLTLAELDRSEFEMAADEH